MIARTIMFLLAFMPFSEALLAQMEATGNASWLKLNQKQPPPRVKILIEHDQDGVVLDVSGKYKLRDPYQGDRPITRYTGKVKFIQALPDGLKWGEEFPGTHQLEIIPASPKTTITVNGKQYKGTVVVYDIGGTVSVVNDIELEDYISALVNNKYDQNLPEEALAALVIAERTNAFYFAQNPKSDFWSLDGSIAGYKGQTPYDPQSPVQSAVRKTRYMVLSPAGSYPGQITAFPISWDPLPSRLVNVKPKPVSSQISITEARDLAKKGDHAAVILDKAFPRTSIQLLRLPD